MKIKEYPMVFGDDLSEALDECVGVKKRMEVFETIFSKNADGLIWIPSDTIIKYLPTGSKLEICSEPSEYEEAEEGENQATESGNEACDTSVPLGDECFDTLNSYISSKRIISRLKAELEEEKAKRTRMVSQACADREFWRGNANAYEKAMEDLLVIIGNIVEE